MSKTRYICKICFGQWTEETKDGKDTVSVITTEHATCRRKWDKTIKEEIERQRK